MRSRHNIQKPGKVKRLLANFAIVRDKIADLNVRDEIRKLQPPVDGNEIMEIFGIKGSPVIGVIKSTIKNAILDGIIAPNDREAALELMFRIAYENGLKPVVTQTQNKSIQYPNTNKCTI